MRLMSMNSQVSQLIDSNRAKIESVCKRYEIKRLLLFGSALRDSWCPKKSDIDLAVEFENPAICHTNKLLVEFSVMFGRTVDVVNICKAQNAYFLRVILTEGRDIV